MSVLNSVIDGKADLKTEANPIITALSSFLMQSGGVQGLMNKFTQAGLGNVFSSWVGSGPRQPVTGDRSCNSSHTSSRKSKGVRAIAAVGCTRAP